MNREKAYGDEEFEEETEEVDVNVEEEEEVDKDVEEIEPSAEQPEMQEESEVQEVVDLDSYIFRFCTCRFLDSVTDRVPSHLVLALPAPTRSYLAESPIVESPPPDAAECATREARRRYASRRNQWVRRLVSMPRLKQG